VSHPGAVFDALSAHRKTALTGSWKGTTFEVSSRPPDNGEILRFLAASVESVRLKADRIDERPRQSTADFRHRESDGHEGRHHHGAGDIERLTSGSTASTAP
jgi:hypothetical protein